MAKKKLKIFMVAAEYQSVPGKPGAGWYLTTDNLVLSSGRGD